MNSKKLRIFIPIMLLVIVFLPVISLSAQTMDLTVNPSACSNMRSLFGVFNCLSQLVKSVIILAFAAALMFFIWNLAMYIKEYDNEAKRQESRQYMIYGIIALFVMVSVWGLVGILQNTFGLGSGTPQYNQGYLPSTQPNPDGSCSSGVLSNGVCTPQP